MNALIYLLILKKIPDLLNPVLIFYICFYSITNSQFSNTNYITSSTSVYLNLNASATPLYTISPLIILSPSFNS